MAWAQECVREYEGAGMQGHKWVQGCKWVQTGTNVHSLPYITHQPTFITTNHIWAQEHEWVWEYEIKDLLSSIIKEQFNNNNNNNNNYYYYLFSSLVTNCSNINSFNCLQQLRLMPVLSHEKRLSPETQGFVWYGGLAIKS